MLLILRVGRNNEKLYMSDQCVKRVRPPRTHAVAFLLLVHAKDQFTKEELYIDNQLIYIINKFLKMMD